MPGLVLPHVVAFAVVSDSGDEAGDPHLHGIDQDVAELRRAAQFGGVVRGRRGLDGGQDRGGLGGGEVRRDHGVSEGGQGQLDLGGSLRGHLQPRRQARSHLLLLLLLLGIGVVGGAGLGGGVGVGTELEREVGGRLPKVQAAAAAAGAGAAGSTAADQRGSALHEGLGWAQQGQQGDGSGGGGGAPTVVCAAGIAA